jgi:membrane protease YdiL (CAAX protease family)
MFYSRIVGVQWFLVFVMLLVLRRRGLSMSDAGERLTDVRLTFAVTVALIFVLAVVSAIVVWRVRRAQPAALSAGLGRMRNLVPAFGAEMAAFAVVCLTAGVCEELLYRGWLLNLLTAATGSPWIAVAVSSITFGIGHAYQGIKGMLRTTFVGLQLAILFVAVGSLIPGQVLHAGVDLLAGIASAMAISRLNSHNHISPCIQPLA